jgi:hypothetical protein
MIAVGVAMLAVALALVLGDVGVYLRARAVATVAADAAALAAAPVTFAAFGAKGSPSGEAGHFAAANGATLVACSCSIDPTWRSRQVEVVVTAPADTILFGVWHVRASSRADFDPVALVHGAGP